MTFNQSTVQVETQSEAIASIGIRVHMFLFKVDLDVEWNLIHK